MQPHHSMPRLAPDEPTAGESAGVGDALAARLARIEARLDALEGTAAKSNAAGTEITGTDEGSAARSEIPPPPPPPPPLPRLLIEAERPVDAGVGDGLPTAPPTAPPTSFEPAAAEESAELVASVKRRESRGFEHLIGGSVAAWVGGLTIAGAATIFATYAYREGWIGQLGPTARFGVAVLVSLALLATGELVRRRLGATASAGFSIAGVGGLFLSTWAGAGPLGVLGPAGMLACGGVAALLGALVTVRSERVSIGVVSLFGGYLLPVLAQGKLDPTPGGVYLTVLLAAALGTSLRGERFRPLRVMALALHTPVAAVWVALGVGSGHSVLPLVLAGLWWAAFCGESWWAALRGQSARLNATTLLSASFGFAAISAVPLARVGRGPGDPMAWVPVLLGGALIGWGALFAPSRPWERLEVGGNGDGDSDPRGAGEAPTDQEAMVERALAMFATAAWGAGGALAALGLGAIVASNVALVLAWSAIAVAAVELGRRTHRTGVALYGSAAGVLAALVAFGVVAVLMGATRTPGGQPMGLPGGGGWLLLLRVESLAVIAAAVAALVCALRWPTLAGGGSWSRLALFAMSEPATEASRNGGRGKRVLDQLAVSVLVAGFTFIWFAASLTIGGSWAAVALIVASSAVLAMWGPRLREQGGASMAVVAFAVPILAWISVAASNRAPIPAPAAAWHWQGMGWGDRAFVAIAFATVAWIAAARIPRTLAGRLTLVVAGGVLVAVAITTELLTRARLATDTDQLPAQQIAAVAWVLAGAAIAWRCRMLAAKADFAWLAGGVVALGGVGWWMLATAFATGMPQGWSWAMSVPVTGLLVIGGLGLTVWISRTAWLGGPRAFESDAVEATVAISTSDREVPDRIRWALAAAAVMTLLVAGHREITVFVDAAWDWNRPSGAAAASYWSIRGAATSLWWGVFGAVLVAAGFRKAIAAGAIGRWLRYGGLGLLGVTAVKFATYDLLTAGTLARIVAMFVVGLLFVGVSVLYARLSRSIGVVGESETPDD